MEKRLFASLSSWRMALAAAACVFSLGMFLGIEASFPGDEERAPRAPRVALPVFEPSPQPTKSESKPPNSLSYEEFLGMLSAYKHSPAAQKFAQDFMARPPLRESWSRLTKERDVERFLGDVRRSPDFKDLLERRKTDAGFTQQAERLLNQPQVQATLRRKDDSTPLLAAAPSRAVEADADRDKYFATRSAHGYILEPDAPGAAAETQRCDGGRTRYGCPGGLQTARESETLRDAPNFIGSELKARSRKLAPIAGFGGGASRATEASFGSAAQEVGVSGGSISGPSGRGDSSGSVPESLGPETGPGRFVNPISPEAEQGMASLSALCRERGGANCR